MPTMLTSPGVLIKDTWRDFVKTWDTTVRYSAWLIAAGVLQILYLFFPQNGFDAWMVLGIIASVAGLVFSIWVIIRLYLVTIAIDANQKITAKTTAKTMMLIWPLVWVGILTLLATLGGLVLLIIPGIYIGVRLGFSSLSVLDKNTRGGDALQDSWTLTKNRFWAVFGRQIAGVVVFGLLFMAVSIVAVILVNLVSGGGALEAIQQPDPNPVLLGIFNLVDLVVQAAFIPLFFLFQVKLYKALRESI